MLIPTPCRSLWMGVVTLSLAVSGARAQDNFELGKMWTFENAPLDYLEQEQGFRPTQEWLDTVRLASLRFGDGCSASFVSAKGLIMTNHHCVRDDLAKNQGGENWVENGFFAEKQEDETRLQGLTVQQLIAMRDVTAEVNAGIETGDDEATIEEKRIANQEKLIEAAQGEDKNRRSEVVELFQGANYQLYTYKIFDDVRAVCTPHLQAAHFGGDFDNFTYPRFGIDFAFCRAYENGEPADTSDQFFRWSQRGPQDGELVFVTGNPGSTERLLTKAQMEYQRDARYPRLRELIDNRLTVLRGFASRDPRIEKQLKTPILGLENAQKAFRGEHEALLRPEFLARKAAAEKLFRERVAADTDAQERYGKVWDQLAEVAAAQVKLEGPASFQDAGGSVLIRRGLAMVRAARGEEGLDVTDIPGSMDPIGNELFIDHLVRARSWLPEDDAFLTTILAGKEPREAVAALQRDSKLADNSFVEELLSKGVDAIMASEDPALAIARVLDPMIQKNEQEGAELEARAAVLGAEIGRALFAVYGNKVSPDATFTLRFSDGRIKGYECNGTLAPRRTVFYGMFARNLEFDDKYPFNLPERWLERRDRINMAAAVNFVCTVDSTGGNSGSPVINQDREIVGLLFDGNIESLANQFIYSQNTERSVCVHVEGILESLRSVYDAERVVEELTAPR